MGLLEPDGPKKIEGKWLDVPTCSICGQEMERVKNSTTNFFIPVYACNSGAKKPCDGDVVRYGNR